MSAPVLPNVSTVLFDVGNTLHHLDHAFIAERVCAHARPVTAQEVARAEISAKRAVDAAFRSRAGGDDSTRQVRYYETILEALSVPTAIAPRIAEELRAENQRASLWRVMHPDTPRVLDELRQRGFKMGVVSNADGRVEAALVAGGLAPYFATIVDSHVVGIEKPDPRIFAIALEACGAASESTVYVGDIYEVDVRGARGAGLTPILLDPLGQYADADCARIAALAELLDRLPGT